VPRIGNPEKRGSTEKAPTEQAYLALQCANLELLESFPSLVAVTNILESLGRILAADV
jgi:hypothetical protein